MIRHAATVPEPGRDAAEWDLDQAADAALHELRDFAPWSPRARWFSSAEPKALATAAALTAASVTVEAGLGEVRRGGWCPEYDQVVLRLFAQPDRPPAEGWESARAALYRFDSALRRVVTEVASAKTDDAQPEATASAETVVVTHGLVLTLWRAHLARRIPDEAMWREVEFPDLWELPEAGLRAWLAGDPPAADTLPRRLRRIDSAPC